MENVVIVRAWHAALAALIAVAVVWQLVIVIDDGRSVANFFSYFTVLSNIAVMVGAALVAVDPHRSGTWFGILRLAGLTGITVTGIVYSTILAGAIPLEGADKVLDTIFHYVVPLASLLGYVALKPRTPLASTAWWALAYPIVWLVYTLIRAEVSSPVYPMSATTTSSVPYDFLDVDAHGVGGVAVGCLAVTVLFVVLAWLYLRLTKPASTPTS